MFKFIIRYADLPHKERIEDFSAQLQQFENSEPISTIVDILQNIEGIKKNDYSSLFDFFRQFDSRTGDLHRTTGSKGKAIDQKSAPFKKDLYDAFYELGFIANNHAEGLHEVDVLAVLGGGFNANYDRCIKAYNEFSSLDRCDKIVALSTYRKISEAEKLKTVKYSPADTEFEVLTDCFPAVFNIDNDKITLFEQITDDLTTSSKIVAFKQRYQGIQIESYAAPKSDPKMLRANTKDTFEFYFKNNKLPKASDWLLITSNIYTPVQIIQFFGQALENEANAKIVGNWEDSQLTTLDEFEVHKYLNELSKVFSEKELFETKYTCRK